MTNHILSPIYAGIDLGGTKIEIAAYDKNTKELYKKRIKAPRGSYRETLNALTQLVQEVEYQLDRTIQVGIGIPGCISHHTGLVKGANSTWLIGKALQKDLSELLKREIRLENDANCFALSEAHALSERPDFHASSPSSKQPATVFGVILGTGVGGGLIVNNLPLSGRNGIAGEWGHNPLPAATHKDQPMPDCYCGRQGCIETYLSGPALEQQYAKLAGEKISAQEIDQRAKAGEVFASQILIDYETRLARALGSVINIFDPDVIILGGGLSNIQRFYKNIPDIWGQYIFSDIVDTVLLPPYYGDSSGVRGAAWLWK